MSILTVSKIKEPNNPFFLTTLKESLLVHHLLKLKDSFPLFEIFCFSNFLFALTPGSSKLIYSSKAPGPLKWSDFESLLRKTTF
jgi:hypothetical protein